MAAGKSLLCQSSWHNELACALYAWAALFPSSYQQRSNSESGPHPTVAEDLRKPAEAVGAPLERSWFSQECWLESGSGSATFAGFESSQTLSSTFEQAS